ncbi:MAG: hypothetical protein FJX34_01160 [Alphaproteobacteria bacterium]|nr:hypothetical protein [Alphaproteobacteria bacterium]
MDSSIEQILKIIHLQNLTRKLLTALCYVLILGGIMVYVFYTFSQGRAIKLVTKHAENIKKYQTEKIMTNPRIKLQHADGKVYDIRAKKAFHKNENDVILYDVFAEGEIGKITAGELDISEEGDHLIFSKNPVLILNKK